MMWHFFPFPKRFCFKCFGRRRILKSPLHSFLLCQINPSAFPICLSLKAVQWGCSQTRVIKKTHQQSNGPSGTAGGHPNLDPHTNPLGGLPPLSLFLLSTSFLREADLVGGQSLIFIHACTRTPWPIFNARVLASHHVAMWGSKFITKREVQAMLVNHQQKVQQCYFQLATLGGKKKTKKTKNHKSEWGTLWQLHANVHFSHLVILEVLNESLWKWERTSFA